MREPPHKPRGVAFSQGVFTEMGSINQEPDMSRRSLFQWALTLDLTFRQFVILKELISFTNEDTCEAWVTVGKLASGTKSSERSVQYALEHLRRAQIITDTGRYHRTSKGGNATIYHIGPNPTAPSKGAARASSHELLHPQGCNSVHPQKRPFQNTSSKNDLLREAAASFPIELTREFLDRHGEGRYSDYLKPSFLDHEKRRLVTATNQARDWFKRDARWLLTKHQLAVVSKAELANG